jgi:NTE family protein
LKKAPFSLVLSGGGALGIAHVGVIGDLERFGVVPSEIIGTSMGGIIGTLLAIGMKEEQILVELKRFLKVSKWVDISFRGNSIIDDHKIKAILEQIFGDRQICETQIPLKLISTDLFTGEKYVFSAGKNARIVDALLATMAIPGIFKEQYIENLTLGDGFLCENLGILEASMDNILAVDVMGKNSFKQHLPDNFFKTSNIAEMLEHSIRLLIYNQTKHAIVKCKKQLYLLEPKTSSFKTFDFSKVDAITALGKGLLESKSFENNDVS